MADWTTITETATDPDAPVTSTLIKALRDNPAAIAEGASGAPRISYDAMGSWFSSTDSVGSIGFFSIATNTVIGPGDTVAGSALKWTSVREGDSDLTDSGSSPTGTWKLLGNISPSGSGGTRYASLFIRVS